MSVAAATEIERTIRELLEPVRATARAMAARGELEWTQSGEVVDASAVRGAVRLRLASADDADGPGPSPAG